MSSLSFYFFFIFSSACKHICMYIFFFWKSNPDKKCIIYFCCVWWENSHYQISCVVRSLSNECTNIHNFACMLKLSILHDSCNMNYVYYIITSGSDHAAWPKRVFFNGYFFCVFYSLRSFFFLAKRYVYICNGEACQQLKM